MENANERIEPNSAVETIAETFLKSLDADFRWELAFPELSEEMIAKLRRYGKQESFPADAILYTHGEELIRDVTVCCADCSKEWGGFDGRPM